MNALFRYLALNAQTRAGFSRAFVIWAAIAAIAGMAAVGFFLVAAFLWLADRYSTVTAGLVLGFLLLGVALIALLVCVLTRRRNIERARVELAVRGGAGTAWLDSKLLDPKLLATGFQIGQSIGWRKLASLGVVAVLAAVLAREWLGGEPDKPEDDEADPT
jgi:hypothetical protein